MKGDVKVSKKGTFFSLAVTITAQDLQQEPSALSDYLSDGWEITKDEREDEDEDKPDPLAEYIRYGVPVPKKDDEEELWQI